MLARPRAIVMMVVFILFFSCGLLFFRPLTIPSCGLTPQIPIACVGYKPRRIQGEDGERFLAFAGTPGVSVENQRCRTVQLKKICSTNEKTPSNPSRRARRGVLPKVGEHYLAGATGAAEVFAAGVFTALLTAFL